MCRMYPVVPMNSRLIAENDVVIGGHFFPKKVNCLHVVRMKKGLPVQKLESLNQLFF